VASVTKQYNLAPTNGHWCLAAGQVTVGLVSHLPCITDINGSPPTGTRPKRARWAPAWAPSGVRRAACFHLPTKNVAADTKKNRRHLSFDILPKCRPADIRWWLTNQCKHYRGQPRPSAEDWQVADKNVWHCMQAWTGR